MEMEMLRNIIMIDWHLKVNILMEKEMEKELNILIRIKRNLKGNFCMVKDGMEKVMIKIKKFYI